ncbi:MAG: hypothetical protein J6V92_03370 [Bacteroidaceae bacterium]|nr:hypothetical protein [Bacteroidaceae bacterium]
MLCKELHLLGQQQTVVLDGLHDLDWRHDDAADGADAGGLPLVAHLVETFPRFYLVLLRQPIAPMEPDGMSRVYQM